MFLQSHPGVFLKFAQRALIYDTHIYVKIQDVRPNPGLAQDLVARFADESSSSLHHIFREGGRGGGGSKSAV
jgi:hypothetical protein